MAWKRFSGTAVGETHSQIAERDSGDPVLGRDVESKPPMRRTGAPDVDVSHPRQVGVTADLEPPVGALEPGQRGADPDPAAREHTAIEPERPEPTADEGRMTSHDPRSERRPRAARAKAGRVQIDSEALLDLRDGQPGPHLADPVESHDRGDELRRSLRGRNQREGAEGNADGKRDPAHVRPSVDGTGAELDFLRRLLVPVGG